MVFALAFEAEAFYLIFVCLTKSSSSDMETKQQLLFNKLMLTIQLNFDVKRYVINHLQISTMKYEGINNSNQSVKKNILRFKNFGDHPSLIVYLKFSVSSLFLSGGQLLVVLIY